MIGLCCHWVELVKGSYENIINERSFKYSSFKENKITESAVLDAWISNVKSNHSILLNKIIPSGLKVFRLSSNLLSLFDCYPQLHSNTKLIEELRLFGKSVLDNDIRITMHPDQFCVLSSDSNDTIKNSIGILKYHAYIFDMMGLPETTKYLINIHGGKGCNSNILINTINTLSDNVRNRLTLENDENSYSVKDLLVVSKATGVPIVFDSHHHVFNTGDMSLEFAMESSISTWKTKPLTHLSNSRPEFALLNKMKRRQHSDFIYSIPELQKSYNNDGIIDIDFECKMKNIAIFEAVKSLGISL